MLRPQDILLALRIQASGGGSFAEIGHSIGISASQAHAAAKRAIQSGILRPDLTVHPRALFETLVGIKRYIPATQGGLARGIPTAYAAPPLSSDILAGDEPPPVWAHPNGTVRGIAYAPLYKTAPDAAQKDLALYELLALTDALRIGRAREIALATHELSDRLGIKQ